ncbi:ABC transporter permease [Paenibacillus gorillae]|uniref:ABC transporter permease n=1 Tax=Paenibacillus gorillae TaxID=1243662 RepID=UPI0004BCCBD0|nr:ABC transporter permease subunit [Paenibacillus gorillae]
MKKAFSLALGQKWTTAALLFLAGLLIVGLLASWLHPFDPYEPDYAAKLQPPSLSHPFGTDYLGRDLFSRVLAGIPYSVFPALIVLGLVMIISLVLGTISGFYGGRLDMLLMSAADLFTAIPNLLLTIVIIGFLGFGMENVYAAILLSWWAKYVRIIRGLVHDVKKEPYMLASRVSGSFGFHAIRRHIVPNMMPQVLTLIILDVSRVILALSGLSFLGLGAQPPSPEWGVMLLDGKNYLQIAPWMGFFPGLMIFVTAVAFQICGERLRSRLQLN